MKTIIVFIVLIFVFPSTIFSQKSGIKNYHPLSGKIGVSLEGGTNLTFSDFREDGYDFTARLLGEYFFPTTGVGIWGIRLYSGGGYLFGSGGTNRPGGVALVGMRGELDVPLGSPLGLPLGLRGRLLVVGHRQRMSRKNKQFTPIRSCNPRPVPISVLPGDRAPVAPPVPARCATAAPWPPPSSGTAASGTADRAGRWRRSTAEIGRAHV